MTPSLRLGLISGLIVFISFAVATTTILTLYDTAIEQTRVRLVETVQSQARLIEAVADFDRDALRGYPGRLEDAVLEQLRRANEAYIGFGETGEFTLATLRDGQILFLLRHRHDTADAPAPVSLDAELAEPMQAALAGESKTLIGLDYRGERVLAATEPVRGLDWGLVAKIDLREVRAPFVRAGLLALGLTAVLTAISVLLSLKLTSPFVDRLREGDRERLRLHSILDALVDGLSDAVFIKDLSGRYVIANPAFCKQMGRPEGAIIGTRDEDLFDAESARRYRLDDEYARRSGQVLTYEEQERIASGEQRRFLTTKGPLIIDGQTQGVFAIAKDITRQKRAEAELREGLERFELAFDQQFQLMVITDPAGRVLEINDLALQTAGVERPDVVGTLFWELPWFQRIDGSAAHARDNIDTARSTRRTFLTEDLFVADDGSTRIAEAAYTPALDGAGALKSIIVQAMDVTERREQAGRLQALLNAIPDLVWMKDPRGEYLLCNQSFTAFLGLPEAEIMGKTDAMLLPPAVADSCRLSDRAAMAAGAPRTNEEDVIYADGRVARIETIKTPMFGPGGATTGLLGIGRDITERKRAERALAEREQRLRAIFDQAAVGIARVDIDGRWSEVNDKLCEILGQTREALLAKTYRDVRAPEDLNVDDALVRETLNGERDAYALDLRYMSPRGEPLWVRLSASLVRAEDASPLYFINVIEDIDARKKAEEKLREAAAVFRSTGEGVVITDADGRILDVNDAFTRITGYAAEEVIGQHTGLLKSELHDLDFYRDMRTQLRATGHWNGEIWNRTNQGALYPSILTISSVESEQGTLDGYVAVFADISSIKVTEARLEHLAHHDPLTDLPNRLLFRDGLLRSLVEAHRRGTKVAVLFFDLDRFKDINDTLGHGVGDELLVQVARRVEPIVRDGDTFGRISGDEFCLVIEGLRSAADASPVVEKLSSVLSEPFMIENHMLRVSASIGVAVCPDHSEDADALLSFADAAMYEAKEAGRNTYRFYTQAMTEQAQEHRFVQSALRDALEQSQFYIVYQPQLDLKTGALVGLEALVRWQHPERGLIPPMDFIRIAEQSGRINELGAWILCSACRQARAWVDEGRNLGRLFVNVAGPQLHDADFPTIVRDCLAETRLPPERLGLEVTESFIMRASEHALEILQELREMGIELAIDDFGTGYSSLSYLKRLPINKLKIDQSFIRDMPADRNDVAITEAIIAMGQALDLTLIAEGIEQPEQAKLLGEMGCQQGQGYLYSRPLTPADLVAWVDAARASSEPRRATPNRPGTLPTP